MLLEYAMHRDPEQQHQALVN